MKNKKGKIIFAILVSVIVVVCIMIQIVLNQDTKRLQEEGKKLETLEIQTKSGEKIETEYTHVGENKFFIKIPTNFKSLDQEMIARKYNGEIPDIVFSNEQTTINVAISMTENKMRDDQIKSYITYMEQLLQNNSEVLDTNYYEVDHHTIGQIKLISKGVDTEIYNNMICFSYDDKLVIIAFNCTKELQEEWQDVSDFIIDSLFFSEE